MARLDLHPRGAERTSPNRLRAPSADHLGQATHGPDQIAVLVSARTVLVCQEEECSLVRKARREFHGLGFAVAEVYYGRIGRREVRSSDPEAGRSDAAADPQPY